MGLDIHPASLTLNPACPNLTNDSWDTKLMSTTPTTPPPSGMRTPVGYFVGGRP